MTLIELQKKFYYIQVRNKFEILKAAELLEKIEIPLFKSDEHKLNILKKNDYPDVDKFFIIKDGDGWRIQSHFIATDNTIEELESEVSIYTRKENRNSLTEKEKEKAEREISKLNKELQSFLCYLYLNYDNELDVKEVSMKFQYLINSLSKRWDINYDDFKKSDDFEATLAKFIREDKLNNIL